MKSEKTRYDVIPLDIGYRKAESMYKKLSKKAGHSLTRTELARTYRRLYATIKKWENDGKIISFIPGQPIFTEHMMHAGKVKNLVRKIEDIPQNKNKAYKEFLIDKDTPFVYLGLNYPQ